MGRISVTPDDLSDYEVARDLILAAGSTQFEPCGRPNELAHRLLRAATAAWQRHLLQDPTGRPESRR